MQKRKLKKSIKLIIAIIVLIISLIVFAISYYNYQLSSVESNKNKEIKEIIVSSGDTGNSIIKKLKKSNLIRSEFISKIYIKLNNISNLQAGIYDIDNSKSTIEIIKMISSGLVTKKDEIKITFKEGKNIRNIAKVISSNTDNKEEDVFNLLKDKEYIDSLIEKYWFITDEVKNKQLYYPLEGYLFPNTYIFKNKSVDVKTIFASMLNQMDVVLTKYKKDIESKKLNIHQFLTLASVVELEGLFDEDRAMIADVFYRRLDAGWSLGSDVTAYYASNLDMGENPEITRAALDFVSPYNTRLSSMAGKLPVGPIANSGEASIKAAINPTDTDYWYFVADCRTMTTKFSKTEGEHNRTSNEIKNSGCKF